MPEVEIDLDAVVPPMIEKIFAGDYVGKEGRKQVVALLDEYAELCQTRQGLALMAIQRIRE